MTPDRAYQQLERLTFFSDAVFAIAMTLLVVEVRLPHLHELSDAALGQALLDLIPNYVGFLISFLVLARFWIAHHAIMGLLARASPALTWTNLFLLLGVAFMPFPTAVISEYAQLRVGVGFYSAWLVVVGLLNRRLVMLASDPALLAADVAPGTLRPFRLRSWIPVAIGLGGLALGAVRPLAGMAALVIGGPLVSWALGRLSLRRG